VRRQILLNRLPTARHPHGERDTRKAKRDAAAKGRVSEGSGCHRLHVLGRRSEVGDSGVALEMGLVVEVDGGLAAVDGTGVLRDTLCVQRRGIELEG